MLPKLNENVAGRNRLVSQLNTTKGSSMNKKIFVYGTLKSSHSNHRLLRNSILIGQATIKGTLYKLGGFPGLKLDSDDDVKGEVWDVSYIDLPNIDRLEGHPSWYRRTPVDSSLGPVETYVYQPKVEDCPKIDGGEWTWLRA